ncbi:MAG: S-layer protein [Candidatus Aenigmarchaeota archaeon]|nr:S-layer protein [Candidatus Aenigmarchaeota archaeon]
MQIKKALVAGALGVLMAGSTVAFATTSLSDYPKPFVDGTSVNTLMVVGASALPSDVVGAVDVAARLGGVPVSKETVKCPGSTAVGTVDGEGKAVATTNTKLYLKDHLGKSGVRSTMTADDLATLLKKGTFQDSNGNQANYKQYIYLTPGDGTSGNYNISFDRPGSSSTADPAYNVGRFTTSPSNTEYLYRTYVTFEKVINSTLAIGEKLNIFGKEYTVQSGTTFVAGGTSNKLVLAGGAETKVLTAGETFTLTLGGETYEVTMVGASSSTQAIVKVKSSTTEDQRTITRSTSNKIAGLDVYVSDVYYLSSTDPTANSAKLLLGAEKLTLQHGSKAKKGDTEDPIDGTYVELTVSSNQLSGFTVYHGATSSTKDYLSAGESYQDGLWKSFFLRFNSPTTADLTASSKDLFEIKNSGVNLLQASITPEAGSAQSITWAYKATSGGTIFGLNDSSGDAIHVVENETITRDQYIILDSGDFTHMFEVTGISLDGSSSASVDMRDVFSGATTKIVAGTDNVETAYIDGQPYYLQNVSSTSFKLTWGAGSNYNSTGTRTTVFPVIKGKNGEKYAFFTSYNNATVAVANNSILQLPTGSVVFTLGTVNATGGAWTVNATTNEDGTSSYVDSAITNFYVNETGVLYTKAIRVGKSASSGVYYNLSVVSGIGNSSSVLYVNVGGSSVASESQPGVILVEEKDADSNYNAVIFTATTETSGSNNVAIVAAPEFTDANMASDTLGSDSNKYQYVDRYGAFVERNTKDQDTVKVYYPDEQVTMDFYVLAEGASVSTGSSTGATTVEKQTVFPIKTALAKLDSEITSADKATKNLILVGGPCVNTLVKDLNTAGKFPYSCEAWPGRNFGLLQVVDDAFASGKTALVVAGTRAEDTRLVTGKLQAYDTAALSGTSQEFTA